MPPERTNLLPDERTAAIRAEGCAWCCRALFLVCWIALACSSVIIAGWAFGTTSQSSGMFHRRRRFFRTAQVP
ncbi:MAG: hypothetical protein ABSD48_01350 [Armatimonadota bacterium]